MNLEQWIVRTSVSCMFLGGASAALARATAHPLLARVSEGALGLAAAVAAVPLVLSAACLGFDVVRARFFRSGETGRGPFG